MGPWYKRPGWIIALLVLFFPVGLALMWLYLPWSQRTKGIVSGLVAVLVLIGALGNATKPAARPTPAQAAVVTSPSPTTTPTPPPSPTAVPATPTPTPAGPSADELAYRATINTQSGALKESMGRFVSLLKQTQGSPEQAAEAATFLNADWTTKVHAELALWKNAYQAAQGFSPPPAYQAFQAKYLAGLEALDSAGDDFASGIDNLDTTTINAGNSKLAQGTQLMQDALALMPPA